MSSYLGFEKAVELLVKQAARARDAGNAAEAAQLEERAARQLSHLYGKLTAWQRTQVARHPARPHFRHFVDTMLTGFLPLAGDRAFADDQALIGGLARFDGRPVMVMGHVKGEDTQSRVHHNFGMARPEGYRKAIRLMDMADRFGLPVITLIDTPGAFPGIEAEERGQAEAIARATERCLALGVPLIAVITGEGGSGGAVALASADRVLMLENAVYSVISPEGCASILWRNADKAPQAAEAMRITAADLLRLGIIDRIVYEPLGGAHRDPANAIRRTGLAIAEELGTLLGFTEAERRADRRKRFLKIGRAA